MLSKRRASVVIWYCTTRCNYLCRHCWGYEHQDLKELDTKRAQSLIKSVAELNPKSFVFSGGEPLLKDVFSGGEPLLREDIIDLIKFTKDCGINLAVDIRTAPLDEELILALARNEVHASITMDSVSPEITDYICGFKDAHQRLMQTIELCRNHGIEFGFNTAAHKLNFEEVPKITKLAEDLGATTHNISMLAPLGKAFKAYKLMSLDSSQFIKCLGDIYQEEQRQRSCKVVVYEPIYLRFVKEAGGVLPKWGRVCKIGKYIHIDTDGGVLPCARARAPFGNALEKPLLEIYEDMASSTFFNTLRDHRRLEGPCASCIYGDLCGGCRMRALALTGDWFASDPACPYINEHGRRGGSIEEGDDLHEPE